MLTELWRYLTTPCAHTVRRLGYLHETIALAARYQRCRAAWQPHLDHSRQALLTTAEACEQHRTALILGSGHLLDIPLAELAGRFEKVLLVDVLHPSAAKRQARRYHNVYLIEHDLTECAETLLALPSSPSMETIIALAQQPPTRFVQGLREFDSVCGLIENNSIDFVASVNLLSQLPLLPTEWLLRHRPAVDIGAINDFSLALMQRHLDYLAAFAAPVCLIADAEQITYSANGDILEYTDFANHFQQLGRLANNTWWWEIAPPGELSDGAYTRHRVAACQLNTFIQR